MVKARLRLARAPDQRGRGRYGRHVAEVLIIEDDDRIRPLLMRAPARARAHRDVGRAPGMDGLQLAVDDRPDLVVLDLGLPDVDGTQVLSMLRAVSEVPVIVATARDDDPSLVGALDAGADDYVVKPFTSAQLDARIRAVLRRTRRVRRGAAHPRRRRPRGRPRRPPGAPRRRPARPHARASSTCSPTSPSGPARWSPSASCSPRCGTSRGAGRTRPSTSTCRGCAASSARPPPSPALPAHRARRRRTPRGSAEPARPGRLRCAAACS